MTTQSLFADLLQPRGEIRPPFAQIRPDSPAVRPTQSRVDAWFSPNSPFSPALPTAKALAGQEDDAQHQPGEALSQHGATLLVDVPALAETIARHHGTTPGFCLAMLGTDDIEAIATGCDPGRVDAWKGFVSLAVRRGEASPRPAPAHAEAVPVRCRDCRHATQTSNPGLIDCGQGVPAPGNCGPCRRWADDPHHCQAFTPSTEKTP